MAKTIEQLTAAATLDGTELVELQQGDLSVQCTTQDIADLAGGGGAAAYLVYTALLSQSGTDAPVATVLQNTLGGTVVWTRYDVGVYFGTLAGAFTEGKTFSIISNTSAFTTYIFRVDSNQIEVNPTDASNTPIDDGLSDTSIEIRVYP